MKDTIPPVPFTRLVAYLRKSRADGEESVEEVLAKHERILQDYCIKTWGSPLPESKLLREVQSGETIAARPVMQQLIGMIQRKEIDAVLVVELQRLSRGDLVDVGELSRLFLYTGCRILTPTREWDLRDEYDKRFFEMELMHGNDFLEYTKRIMARGRERSIRDGNYINSRAPFGYSRVFVDKRPTLEIVPAEAEIVRLIFELYAGTDHLGPSRIANRLNQMGIPSSGTGKWSEHTIRGMIQNPVYVGNVSWNRRKTVKQYKDGRIVDTHPVADEYILADARHEPIISQELWDSAQEAARSRSHPCARLDRDKIVHPLAGLLVCSRCGRVMAYKQCYDYKSKKPLAPIFMCRLSGCETRGATVADVMSLLTDSLRRSLADLQVDDLSSPASDPTASAKAACRAELADLEKQRERMYDYLERGLYDETTFRRRMSVLAEKISISESALAELDRKEKSAEEKQAFRSALQLCVDALSDPESTPDTTNKLLKQILARVEYTREKSPRRKWDATPITLNTVFK